MNLKQMLLLCFLDTCFSSYAKKGKKMFLLLLICASKAKAVTCEGQYGSKVNKVQHHVCNIWLYHKY